VIAICQHDAGVQWLVEAEVDVVLLEAEPFIFHRQIAVELYKSKLPAIYG
jgi:hypothetical protein